MLQFHVHWGIEFYNFVSIKVAGAGITKFHQLPILPNLPNCSWQVFDSETCCKLTTNKSNTFMADNFGNACLKRWRAMFFQYGLVVFCCRMQRSILVMASIHVEKPTWRPAPIEPWRNWGRMQTGLPSCRTPSVGRVAENDVSCCMLVIAKQHVLRLA